tara:strand:+ start:361 stop:1257 length:897 start_codon:yes stop_codon:yes gene_type:complete
MNFNYLDELESEAIYIIREVASEFENPCILFSGGKDSIVLCHIAKKAFYPSNVPFPLIHIDTGHNFPETIKFRDNLVKENNLNLIVGSVEKLIDDGEIVEEKGKNASRNSLQIPTLLSCLEKHNVDAAIGGARRDEEKARAKERIFSHRDEFGQWNPKNQRPELWNIFNTKYNYGENFRVFPLSNWTEIDVWKYIEKENIELPSLYFSHKRKCIIRNGVILAHSKFIKVSTNEKIKELSVRYRTCGDMTITGAIESNAKSLKEVIAELLIADDTERSSRADDKRSDTSMEDRKVQGYF